MNLVHTARRLRLRWRRARLDYDREEHQRSRRLASVLGVDPDRLAALEREYDDLDWFHEAYSRRIDAVDRAGVLAETTHWRDGKTAYVVCRALGPDVAVETGVRFGSFDAHLTAAMHVAGQGHLHALDRPGSPPGPFQYGHAIPERCRDRWTLQTGDAGEVLEDLLEAVGPIDLFLHDSDHRADHMRFEFRTAHGHLRPGGVLASHDVRLSPVFEAFCADRGLPACVVADTGIARRPPERTGAV